MTLEQRLMAVFRRETPDVMPWFADLTYWYSAAVHRGTLPEEYRGDGVVDLYRDLACGCHEHALNQPWKTQYEDVQITVHEEDAPGGGPPVQTTRWRTPVGTITQTKQYEPQGCCWAYRRYPVQSPDDLAVLRFIHENRRVTPSYATQERQLELWRDWGVPSSVPLRTPLARLIVIWMGVTNTVYALADARKDVEHTLDVLDATDDPIYEIIARSPAPLVYFGDNITGEVVSPSLFNAYFAPCYRKRARQLHAAGKYIFVHIDGTFRALLPHVGPTGVDCAQSLTPAPVGDVPVAEMRELAGGELILWGGVPAAFFSPVYPEEALQDIVMECIEHHRDEGKFMLCVCDQVPPDGIIERVKLVSDLVEEHGRIA
jgi:hypothetical protein